jgi:hypothetical protein
MTPESKPVKSEWMRIAESDNASSNVRKVDKRLTLGTLASVGAIVIAGSLFANASDEPSAVADITPITSNVSSTVAAPVKATSTLSAATPQVAKIQDPAISQMPTGGGDDDEDDDEHEGREDRGGDHDDDDDDDEDDD